MSTRNPNNPNTTGGPFTEDGKARALANLLPGESALKHGVQTPAGVLMFCDRCPLRDGCKHHRAGAICQPEEEYVSERRAELRAVPHISVLDWPALEVLLWSEVRLTRAARYLAAKGELAADGEDFLPVAKHAEKLMTSWRANLLALSLTPSLRRELERTSEAPNALREAFRELETKASKAKRGEVTEAEFTMEDTGEGADAGADHGADDTTTVQIAER